MKKRSLGILLLSATIFTGCGGGGGSSTTTYDLYNYMFNPEVLENDKVLSSHNSYISYIDGIKFDSHEEYILTQKYDENSIEEYTQLQSYITTTDEYNNNISSETPTTQYDIEDTQINEIDIEDATTYEITRKVLIGEQFLTIDNDFVCNLSKHFDSLNIKDTIESFYSTNYESIDKTYTDVLEVVCTSTYDIENYLYFAKNEGLVLDMYNEILPTGEKQTDIDFVVEKVLLDK